MVISVSIGKLLLNICNIILVITKFMFMSILVLGGFQFFQRTTSFGSLSINLKNCTNFLYIKFIFKFFYKVSIFNYYYYFGFHMDGSVKFDNYWFNSRHFFQLNYHNSFPLIKKFTKVK